MQSSLDYQKALETLRLKLEESEKREAKLQSDLDEMIQKAIKNKLPAYREQGENIFKLENRIEDLIRQNNALCDELDQAKTIMRLGAGHA